MLSAEMTAEIARQYDDAITNVAAAWVTYGRDMAMAEWGRTGLLPSTELQGREAYEQLAQALGAVSAKLAEMAASMP